MSPTTPPSLPRLGLTLFALWLVVFGSMSQILIVTPILPRIGEQFAANTAALGWLLTGYAIPLSISTLLAGPISDRIGRRRILIIGAGALGLALLGHLLARHFAELLLARLLAGACGGLLSGGAFAYIGDAIPEHRRGWATGWVNTGFAGGQIFSIPLGSWLAASFDARLPFAVFGVVMLLACLLVLVVVPQPDVARSSRITLRSLGQRYAGLVRHTDSLGACLVYASLLAGIGLFVPYLPLFLEQSAGLSPLLVSLVFTAGGATMVIVGPRAGRLSDRVGRKRIGMAGTGLVAVCMLSMPLATLAPALAFVIFSLTMAGAASRSGALRTLVAELVPAPQRGLLIYVSLALGQMGFAVGSALAGPIHTVFGFGGNAVAGMLASLLTVVLVAALLPETLGREAAAEAQATTR